jgi:hypothetical protein
MPYRRIGFDFTPGSGPLRQPAPYAAARAERWMSADNPFWIDTSVCPVSRLVISICLARMPSPAIRPMTPWRTALHAVLVMIARRMERLRHVHISPGCTTGRSRKADQSDIWRWKCRKLILENRPNSGQMPMTGLAFGPINKSKRTYLLGHNDPCSRCRQTKVGCYQRGPDPRRSGSRLRSDRRSASGKRPSAGRKKASRAPTPNL